MLQIRTDNLTHRQIYHTAQGKRCQNYQQDKGCGYAKINGYTEFAASIGQTFIFLHPFSAILHCAQESGSLQDIFVIIYYILHEWPEERKGYL
jgi:hypothetical protein